jgi:hypothetical protein
MQKSQPGVFRSRHGADHAEPFFIRRAIHKSSNGLRYEIARSQTLTAVAILGQMLTSKSRETMFA